MNNLCDLYPKEELINNFSTMAIGDLIDKYKVNFSTICSTSIDLKVNLIDNGDCIYNRPNRDEFLEKLNNGKVATSRYYHCTIPVINRWIKEYDIVIEKYQGKLPNIDLEQFKVAFNDGLTDRQLARKFGYSVTIIKRFAKRHNLELKSMNDDWQVQRDFLDTKFDWICTENESRDVLSIAKELDITPSTVLKFLKSKGHDIISHSYNKSSGEKELKDFIIELGFICKSVKKNHNGLSREIDCFIEELNIGVEYCGEYWHSDINKPKNYHSEKLNWCLEQGIQLITIFENEWVLKKDLVKSMIAQRLGKVANRYFARKLVTKEITINQANAFFEEHHIHGGLGNTSKSLALLDINSNIICVMSFLKSRFNKDFEWEIGRFATLQNSIVVGGASKLFNYFIETVKPNNCLSYCDLRFGSGKVYGKMGFEFIKNTVPGYFYFHKPTGLPFNRIKFQKHKLSKELTNFDVNLTEYDNMIRNNYLRVWDCGNALYTWNAT